MPTSSSSRKRSYSPPPPAVLSIPPRKKSHHPPVYPDVSITSASAAGTAIPLCVSTTTGVPSFTDAASRAYCALLQTHPSFLSLGTLYPALASCRTFDDVIEASRVYADYDPVAVACDAAPRYFHNNPTLRVNLDTVARDAAAAASQGLRALITTRIQSLGQKIYQPNVTIVPPVDTTEPSVPPYPTAEAIANFPQLAHGSPLMLLPDFVPHPHAPPAKDDNYELAMERHYAKFHRDKTMLILPAAPVSALCVTDNLRLNVSPTFIVRKVDALVDEIAVLNEAGRAVANYTHTGLNHPTKKKLLGRQFTPIGYPTRVVLCRTLLRVKARFPPPCVVVLTKEDFSAWFNRVPCSPDNVTLTALPLYINGESFLCLPLVEQFGLQDSNYHSNLGSAVIYAAMRADDWQHFGMDVAHLYSDDEIGFVPDTLVAERRLRYQTIAESVAGKEVISQKKHSAAVRNEAIGSLFDCDAMTMSLSPSLYLKIVCLLFIEIQMDLQPGQSIPINTLERLGAYMILAGDLIPFLRPFSRAAHENLQGALALRAVSGLAKLKLKTIIDIRMWRVVWRFTHYDASCLVVPVHVPHLLSPLPSEAAVTLALRQEAAAHLIISGDACTYQPTDPLWGCGFLIWRKTRPLLWAGHQLQKLTHYDASTAIPIKAHINLYELLAIVAALDCLCRHIDQLRPPPPSPHATLLHVHVWTDNTSALSWLTNLKAAHPLHAFLLQVVTHLQTRYRVLLTFGHLPGKRNVHADAVSRNFQTSNGSQIRQSLSRVTRHLSLPPWWHTMLKIAEKQTTPTWEQAVASLTLLAGVHGDGTA